MSQHPAAPNSRTAIVTGGSRGLGLALTRRLAQEGWHVVVDGRDGDRLLAVARGLPEGSLTTVPGDVADDAHRARLIPAAPPPRRPAGRAPPRAGGPRAAGGRLDDRPGCGAGRPPPRRTDRGGRRPRRHRPA